MCTLSFLSSKNDSNFIVTSNRDESVERGTIPPKIYEENGVELCFPKDEVAGGTWIGASSRKRLVCLMNGGFKAHERQVKYRMSRGLVVKGLLLAEEKGEEFLKDIDLENVEPFTIVNIEWKDKPHLLQLVWDGLEKHFETLPIKPRIWSASMLYSDETKKERKRLFEGFLKERQLNVNSNLREEILDFHRGLSIDRGILKTTSITQFVYKENESKMFYEDLMNGEKYAVEF